MCIIEYKIHHFNLLSLDAKDLHIYINIKEDYPSERIEHYLQEALFNMFLTYHEID